MSEKLNRLLRVPEVARWLNLPEDRVYALTREGLLPHVRLGRQIRFNPTTIEEFILNGGQALPGGWRREAQNM